MTRSPAQLINAKLKRLKARTQKALDKEVDAIFKRHKLSRIQLRRYLRADKKPFWEDHKWSFTYSYNIDIDQLTRTDDFIESYNSIINEAKKIESNAESFEVDTEVRSYLTDELEKLVADTQFTRREYKYFKKKKQLKNYEPLDRLVSEFILLGKIKKK